MIRLNRRPEPESSLRREASSRRPTLSSGNQSSGSSRSATAIPTICGRKHLVHFSEGAGRGARCVQEFVREGEDSAFLIIEQVRRYLTSSESLDLRIAHADPSPEGASEQAAGVAHPRLANERVRRKRLTKACFPGSPLRSSSETCGRKA